MENNRGIMNQTTIKKLLTRLSIDKIPEICEIKKECLDIDRHKEENWFRDENRQMGFLVKKLKEINQKKTSIEVKHGI